MIYFTSDPHFGHTNIITYCQRPYRDVDEMNEELVSMFNVAGPEDTVYCLGDFAFMKSGAKRDLFSELTAGELHLIRGNHDNGDTTKMPWDSVQDYLEIRPRVEYQDDEGEIKSYPVHIVMSHFPFLSWNGMAHGSMHLHGHCHGTLQDKGGLRMDVGVDPCNYKMVSLNDVIDYMALRTVVPTDYHKADHGR